MAPGVLRSLVATGTCGSSTALLTTFCASTAQGTHVPLDGAVSIAVLAVGALAAAVLTVGCVLLTLTALARAAGRTLGRLERVTARLTPALLRRAVAVTMTAGIGLGALSEVATASEIDLGWDVTENTSVPPGPDRSALAAEDPGLGDGEAVAEHVAARDSAGRPSAEPEPTRAGALDLAGAPPVSSPPTTSATTARTTPTTAATHPGADIAPATEATVTVRAGDTLWAIAASHLPPGSDDAAVAAAWPRWYEANRDVIGPDPDLIHPGQVLAAPGAP